MPGKTISGVYEMQENAWRQGRCPFGGAYSARRSTPYLVGGAWQPSS